MSPPATRRHAVFDLDGTLVDSIPGIDAAARAALHEISPELRIPTLRPFIGPPIRRMIQTALDGPDDTQLDQLETAFRRHYDAGAWRETQLYSGVHDTLLSLKSAGVHLHVLTNKPALPTRLILNHLGLTVYFDSITTPQSRTPHFKDKTEAALALRNQQEMNPARTLLMGDSIDDKLAAAAAEFTFAAATWGYGNVHLTQPTPTCILNSFSELLTAQTVAPYLRA